MQVPAPLSGAVVALDVLAADAFEDTPPGAVGATPDDAVGTLGGLTKREREVLGHIVAGRTYGEIARARYLE